MATSVTHAQSSVRKFGGSVEDFLPIHNWFDATKEMMGDFRHRALRHHTTGVRECVEKFGPILTLSTGRQIPTQLVAEQHLIEDFGYLPTLQDWLNTIVPQKWMVSGARKLSKELDKGETKQ